MSTIINADTSDGLKFTSDTSGEIKLQSAGADTVTVNTSGNVGIGTSSPSHSLTINKDGTAIRVRTDDTNSSTFNVGINASSGIAYLESSLIGSGSYVPMTFYSGGSERMRIDSSGSLRVGGTSSFSLNEKIALYGTSTANNPTIISDKSAAGVVSSNHVLFNNGNGYVGSITTLNSGTAFNTSSDYRLKENVAPMSGSIDRLKQLKPSTWAWIHGGNGEGFLAHEAQAVVPEAVTGTKDAVDDEGNPVYQGIDQSKLVPLLTAALQEAITKIEDLETRIQALENA